MTAEATIVLACVGGILVLVAIILGRRIDAKVGSVHVQLSRNGGESALDAIHETRQIARELREKVIDLDARVTVLEDERNAASRADRPAPAVRPVPRPAA